MTTHDDNPWAPGGDTPSRPTPTPGSSAPIPDAPSQWGPPPSRPPVDVGRPPTTASPQTDEPVDRVVVGPVDAAPRSIGGALGRIVAGGAAAVLIGGGAFLAFGAATAEGGAATPEDAIELALAAVSDEDVVALAELMEPAERSTLFEAGFDFVDELIRLDVLDDDMDMSAVEGIDLQLAGFEPRVERPGNDLAHIYLGTGTISGNVSVAELPLGQLVLDRLDAEQQAYTDSNIQTTDPTSTPLVAVERDGRWYLSLWYTVAENLRLDVGSPLPDPFDRPAAIGGDTPEDAVRLLFEELIDLDVRRMIGALDPEEMAVLYDYAPLFLDDVEPATNSLLEEARASGWEWRFDELSFTSTDLADDLAEVTLSSFTFSAESAAGSSVSVSVSSSAFSLDATLVDEFFGDELAIRIETDGACIDIELSGDGESSTERICADDIANEIEIEGLSPQGGLEGIDQVGVVTREVDGTWYISPIRTGLEAMITAVEELDPDTLADLVDELLTAGDQALGSGLDLPGIDLGGGDFADPGGAFGSTEPFEPFIEIENGDLLADELDPTFAYDMNADAARTEIGFWAPALTEVGPERGVYATIPGRAGGDVAVVSIDVFDVVTIAGLFEGFAAQADATVSTTPDGYSLVETVDPFGDPLFVAVRDDRLVIVGVYGASVDDARRVLESQLAGS